MMSFDDFMEHYKELSNKMGLCPICSKTKTLGSSLCLQHLLILDSLEKRPYFQEFFYWAYEQYKKEAIQNTINVWK